MSVPVLARPDVVALVFQVGMLAAEPCSEMVIVGPRDGDRNVALFGPHNLVYLVAPNCHGFVLETIHDLLGQRYRWHHPPDDLGVLALEWWAVNIEEFLRVLRRILPFLSVRDLVQLWVPVPECNAG